MEQRFNGLYFFAFPRLPVGESQTSQDDFPIRPPFAVTNGDIQNAGQQVAVIVLSAAGEKDFFA
ncbi:hypothetical protein DK842_20930 [Chromobacterium phragmitis]|uniref:Uncharacterized protein n=1 Tax=Chromobacterium phragmitis TaxID=2202141 RepID=A0A344UE42_9NEIS|nr:hypothetical protein [Chromobacterium phragmitis]AXE32149.1 hypothetical protein DK842_20930 [Chromobacterium phragmitis]AXE33540.1 hypothetical protein DK843_03920 [Chromobacterium phragmitis]